MYLKKDIHGHKMIQKFFLVLNIKFSTKLSSYRTLYFVDSTIASVFAVNLKQSIAKNIAVTAL